MRACLLLLPALLLAACDRPVDFAPPAKRQPLTDYRPYRPARVIRMNDADAEAFFTRDIVKGPVETSWRWTGKKPTITLHLRAVEKLIYTIEFAIPEVTFAKTGPVNVTLLVNQHVLEVLHVDKPGVQSYQKLVPDGWMSPGQPVEVGAEIDKTYTSSLDGETLGFLLTQLGLARGPAK